MHTSRRDFIQKMGLSALSILPGTAVIRALAEEPPTPAKIDGMEVRKALPATADNVAPGTPDFEINAHFANHGLGFGRRIAITFDDGPAPATTPLVLEELRKRELQATFFMLGQMVRDHPDTARQVLAAGHEIGNHSFTHPQLGKMPQDKVEEEIQSTQEMITKTTNFTPVWFRPPYGSFRKDQGPIASSKGLGVMYWSVDPNDWRKPGVNVVVERVLTETHPGSVILLHDIHKSTCDAVPAILDGLLERGFEFTSISNLVGLPYEPA